MPKREELLELKKELEGDLYCDDASRLMYATDASAYREMPVAVTRPKNNDDIKKVIAFARQHKTSLIPRTAGTSLAGQVVGSGIVVDVSKYMTQILEINEKEKWVRVQPGVILDELNKILETKGLFFGPETSTSSRCMIGGMVGNNSCGAHSIVYGSTRDHTLSVNAILSDGSEVVFGEISAEEFQTKIQGDTLENSIYKNVYEILNNPVNQQEIIRQYPDKSLKRRNTGYAIDLLLDCEPFTKDGVPFNFCRLIAGSEGTLAFITEIKLNLVPLPPKEKVLVCVHLNSVHEALHANLIALKHGPYSIELMDKAIMDLTKENITQNKNRFFVQGDPGAILIVEFAETDKAIIESKVMAMESEMKAAGYGFHFPVVSGSDMKKVWDLRKAGLGILSNYPGDSKPVSLIEDTAVNPKLLPDYVKDLDAMLACHKLSTVYYAHISTGELHIKPALNLKDPRDVELFRTVAMEAANIVKKYKGSLSGEHGDGRLRGEFIPLMVGEHNYELLKQLKKAWDPDNIFNPGKITDTPRMNTSLRYEQARSVKNIETVFDFSHDHGILKAVEKCNGSADCRKSSIIGGTMCPSYMATKDETHSTRARANILREFLTNSPNNNPFDHKEIYAVMDLCLSCKACKSECPSNVDITKYKAEFLQHYYDEHGVPFRARMIADITRTNSIGAIFPSVFNFFITNKFFSGTAKQLLGFAPKRTIPKLYRITLRKWFMKFSEHRDTSKLTKGKVYLFADEFTDYNDTEIGIRAIELLTKLGYRVELPNHVLSGRTYLSKGLLRKAKKIANTNVALLKDVITDDAPLLGIEPSGILAFRDEYTELVDKSLKEASIKLAANCFMIDEFIIKEFEKGNISKDLFSKEAKNIRLHGHCHQKALASTEPTKKMLEIPFNFKVVEIKSGCCGMAGGFGYEKEHYEVSMKVGELVLFPEIRKTTDDVLIAAPGTSCRHQIKDGTGRKAYHPVEILYEALIK
ncbi:MAG: FAD-linked oxidase C-terminal domain-containing protein [Bacteroidales bacterium]